jgi:pantothenate synthetase
VAVSDGRDPAQAAASSRSGLLQAGFAPVDYVEVRDAETLAPADPGTQRPLRVLAAAWLGKTRLIDNVGANPKRHPVEMLRQSSQGGRCIAVLRQRGSR